MTRPGRPLLRMRWDDLTYVSWRIEPDQAAALLPAGVTVDLHDGAAWVSLVPFQMRSITVAGVALPYGTFPETNVRTYVIGPDGQPGVHFHSLDIPHAAPVAVARTVFHLPYHRSDTTIGRAGTTVTYRTVRRSRRRGPVGSVVTVDVGAPITDPSPLDVFLTDRTALYTTTPGGTVVTVAVHHRPWQLRHATLRRCDDQLVAAAGWPDTGRTPDHVVCADGVTVTAGPPHRRR